MKTVIPQELVDRYATRGPRYTSYPPASSFVDQVDAEEVKGIWLASREGGEALSLYFHVPFCRKRCLYCGCHTTSRWDRALLDGYLDALLREVAMTAGILGEGTGVAQLALGGGTPNTLPQDMMAALLAGIRERFTMAEGSEVSIELDPRVLEPADVDFLVESGFNRFSLGVQDLDPGVQKIIGRVQPEERIRSIVDRIRARGMEAINFDLIYGLPGQTLESFRETVDRVIEIGPSRIAVFGYAHVPWVHPHQKALEKAGLPATDMRAELVNMFTDRLVEAGYIHIGLDHFAVASDELARALESRRLHRNFMGYTTRKGLRLAAMGSSAISGVGSSYVQDDKDIQGYMKTIAEESRLPWRRGWVLSRDDVIRRDLIMDLFCNLHVDLGELGRRYGIDPESYFDKELEAVGKMGEDGLLALDGSSIELTPVGRHFVRNVCMVFDRYLERDETKRVHSKTL
jgi:oxygen-independent coproporphyrinogen-3 oxidase